MASVSCGPSAAQAAGQILRLLGRDQHADLGAELERIREIGAREARNSGLTGERWELLEATADGMRASQPPLRPAVTETYDLLLEHLASGSVPRRAGSEQTNACVRARRRSLPPPGRPSCSRL